MITTSPQEITVQVSNGTSTAGLATTAANQLKRNGFNVMTPDDYPSSLKATTVFFSRAMSRPQQPWPRRSAIRKSSGSPGSDTWFR
ncbi:lytR cell envelope-related transcriptional attenuator family protein [Mycobacterium kansasii]|uniref:LytR cell envelope-related transcriptional attenuator family protein n=1 Tax=Mycobacterium kansasii TaxID=1768 RepID=A0A1V3WUY0_MYCKA|nr:lytR cell envelope-related transcriptional attenuator family protein [Mycobacterium kansasii]